MRSTTAQTGTVNRAPATNIAPKRRTMAVRSAAGPTMKPGVSASETTGSRPASHRPRNAAALSAASPSIAPPRCRGLLASSPTACPPMRASAVTTPMPNPARSSSTLPESHRALMTGRTS